MSVQVLKRIPLVLTLCFAAESSEQNLWAQGASPSKITAPAPSCPITPAPGTPSLFSTPVPIRMVRLHQIGTKSFQLPNGASADMSFDMQSMLNTVVTNSNVMSPSDPLETDPCNAHLELRSTVTNFQLDLVDVGISFGFTPTGSMSTITSITGAAKVRIGTVSMDFSLWQCNGGNCYSVAASTSTHVVSGGGLTFTVDFSVVNTGGSLVYDPALSTAMRGIMSDGIKQLVNSPRFSELAWMSRVESYNPSTGVLIIGAGEQANLGANQTFEIYAPTDTTTSGICDVFQTVAYAHTSAVNQVASQAMVDQVLDPRGVIKGDVVMVRIAPKNNH
jgi:hypothetical protein